MYPTFQSTHIDSYTCTLIYNQHKSIHVHNLSVDSKGLFSNASGDTLDTSLTSSDESFIDTASDPYSIVDITSDLDRTIDITSDSEITEMVSVVG